MCLFEFCLGVLRAELRALSRLLNLSFMITLYIRVVTDPVLIYDQGKSGTDIFNDLPEVTQHSRQRTQNSNLGTLSWGPHS